MFGPPAAHLLGEIQIHDAACGALVAINGSIGAGEAFIHGYWSTPDLTAVIRCWSAIWMCSTPWKVAWRGWPPVDTRPALDQPQYAQGLAKKHCRALRPGQRIVRALPRPHHDVFGGPLRATRHDWNERKNNERICHKLDLTPATTCSRSGPAGAAWRSTRRNIRLQSHDDDLFPGAVRLHRETHHRGGPGGPGHAPPAGLPRLVRRSTTSSCRSR